MSTNNRTKESTFDGSTLVEKLILIGCFLLTILTFGLALWYLVCTYQRWNTKHTVYDGKRLVFEGTGKNYFYTIFFGSFFHIITLFKGVFGLVI